MIVESVITSVLGTEDFARYEQNLYEKYQDRAERELIAQLNELLSNGPLPHALETMECSMCLSFPRIP